MKTQIQKTDFPQILTTGRDALILQAKQAPKISTFETDKDLIETLSTVFALIGIRGTNLPDDFQTRVLISFIRSNFGFLTIKQIRQAFTMYAAGELQNVPDHFQTFSAVFFSKVIRSYQNEVERATRENERALAAVHVQSNEPTPEEKRKLDRDFYLTIAKPFIETGDSNFLGFIPAAVVYDFIHEGQKENSSIYFNHEQKNSALEFAKIRLKYNAESEKNPFERIRLLSDAEETTRIISEAKAVLLETTFFTAEKKSKVLDDLKKRFDE